MDDRADLGRHRAGERCRRTGLNILGGGARGLLVVGRDREVRRERELLQADHGRALGGRDPDPFCQRLAMLLGIGIPGALDGRETENGTAARLLHPRRRGERLADARDHHEVGHDATPASGTCWVMQCGPTAAVGDDAAGNADDLMIREGGGDDRERLGVQRVVCDRHDDATVRDVEVDVADHQLLTVEIEVGQAAASSITSSRRPAASVSTPQDLEVLGHQPEVRIRGILTGLCHDDARPDVRADTVHVTVGVRVLEVPVAQPDHLLDPEAALQLGLDRLAREPGVAILV